MDKKRTSSTITISGSADLRPGDHIRIADTRRWWVKVWHWIIRRKPPTRDWRVTDVGGDTCITITPAYTNRSVAWD